MTSPGIIGSETIYSICIYSDPVMNSEGLGDCGLALSVYPIRVGHGVRGIECS